MIKPTLTGILFLLSQCVSLNSVAQKIDSVVIDGKQYYVYPFKKNVKTHYDYKNILDAEGDYTKQMKAYHKRLEKGDQTVTEKELEYMANIHEYISSSSRRPGYMTRKLIKAMRRNPYPMLTQYYSLETDVTPVLDPMPDGEYIQYFDDFCLTDEKGKCQNTGGIIAGKFFIKDNLLNGEAMWFNLKGDTLKHGHFEKGLKEGVWKIENRSINYSLQSLDRERYIELGSPEIDTVVEYFTFHKGAKNGEYRKYEDGIYPKEIGEFTDGEETGTWIFRDVQYKFDSNYEYGEVPIRDNNVITRRFTYASDDDTAIVCHPWIRKGLYNVYDGYYSDFDFYDSEPIRAIAEDLFSIAFEKEEELDLEEEMFDSHAMDDDLGHLRSDYFYDYYETGPTAYVFDTRNMSRIKRGSAIDSLGMTANYSGKYEVFYFNGEKEFTYEFKDGKLVKEDTIFWPNGQAHDVITKIADSNYYLRSIYDVEGKLFTSLVYDSLGDFVDYAYQYDDTKYIEIEGFKMVDAEYGNYQRYYAWDTLETELTAPVVVEASWGRTAHDRISRIEYDPIERVLTSKFYGANGEVYETIVKNFAEDLNSWTGTAVRTYGPYTLHITRSASISESHKMDSSDVSNIHYPVSRFDVTEEQQLFLDGKPYTGEVSVEVKGGREKVNTDEFDILIPHRKSSFAQKIEKNKRYRQLQRFREKGKPIKSLALSVLNSQSINYTLSERLMYMLLPENVINKVWRDGEDFYYELTGSVNEGTLKGYMLDGKPTGMWTFTDSKGNVKREAEFEKGEMNGVFREYEWQSTIPPYYGSVQLAKLINDSLPEERTLYLSREIDYKNDKMDGVYRNYNWLGKTLVEEHYKDGFMDGPAVERNALLVSFSNFKDGLPDGYYQTYLTLPGRDSILLYDLNFQDGLLQGESQAYHTNGALAKRGFFLNGDPIEDYEAFDSLGFKYHYVKFQYSYPIEEKLWEENQLSVRYLFDWEDSIRFVPSGFTQTESLDRLAAKLGLADDYLSKPYYGRNTLVSKWGVKCHMTKYYPNDTIARDGDLESSKKVGLWKYYGYNGDFLYQVNYFDSIFALNDSIKFKSKGIYTDVNAEGDTLYKAYVIEKFEKYDCSHTDHYEIRQLYTFWEADDSVGRMNGYVRNFYDNGTIQSEGEMKDGLPTGPWKLYDPFGKLNQYGYYVQGKRNGRWLSGDLSKTKYLGDICLNPNLPNLESEIKYRENLLDVIITNYKLGKALNRQFYDINMNQFQDVEEEEANLDD